MPVPKKKIFAMPRELKPDCNKRLLFVDFSRISLNLSFHFIFYSQGNLKVFLAPNI